MMDTIKFTVILGVNCKEHDFIHTSMYLTATLSIYTRLVAMSVHHSITIEIMPHDKRHILLQCVHIVI